MNLISAHCFASAAASFDRTHASSSRAESSLRPNAFYISATDSASPSAIASTALRAWALIGVWSE